MTIIIAEDDDKVRETYIRAIRHFSKTEVEGVSNGRDLVEKVKERDYDLIFTDNDMPLMSGLFAITQIRGFNSKVPICMVSGDKIEETMSEAMKIGATDYIDKGDYNNFTANLKNVIGKYFPTN